MKIRQAVVMGGVGIRRQVEALRRGVDILIATPGRLLDLVDQRQLDLSATEYLILDEADRMLDMGFIRDVRKIVARMPDERQTLLFSATMPPEIGRLASEILYQPERIEIAARTVTVDRIEQQVYHVDPAAKRDRLVALLADQRMERVIVFTRTKHGADRVVKHLGRAGIAADALHGNKSQAARQKALARFRSGESRVLVATDIASRGIDVDGVTHVINYELPNIPESYVHRIGRTARAGAAGIAISLCDASERAHLKSIERLIKRPLDVVGEGPVELPDAANANDRAGRRGSGKKRRRPHPRAGNRAKRRSARRAA